MYITTRGYNKHQTKKHFSHFLEQHQFTLISDPEFDAVWSKFNTLYRSSSFDLMFGGHDEFSVCGRPNYTPEDWCGIPEVLAFIHGVPDPVKYENNAKLASLIEENYETIRHFFSVDGEDLRKIKFAEWVENYFWRLKSRSWK